MRQLLVSASLLFRGVFRRWWAWVVGSLLAFCGLYRTYIKPELPQDYRYDIPVWLLWIVGALSLAWAAVRAYHELRMKMLDLQKQVENEQELRAYHRQVENTAADYLKDKLLPERSLTNSRH